MSSTSVSIGGKTNSAHRSSAGSSTQSRGLIFQIVAKARAIWVVKPAHELADRCAASPRTAERWFGSSPSVMQAESLAALLRSEEGFQFLCVVMAESDAKWWRLCRAILSAAEVRKMQRAAQRKMRRLIDETIDADRSLSAMANRAEAALAFSDEDFLSPHADALRSMAGGVDRAVASKGRRR